MIFILMLLFAFDVKASDLKGRVFADVYLPQRAGLSKPLTQAYLGTWLEKELETETTQGRLVLEGYLSDQNNSNIKPYNTLFDGGIREGFIKKRFRFVELTLGQQILVWGKTDGFSPMDLLTARNAALFNPDEEVRRRGGAALRAVLAPQDGSSPWSLSLVGQFIHPRGDYVIPNPIVPVERAEYTKVDFNNTEWAAKLDYQGDSWDSSLIYFSGFDHSPYIKVQSITGSLFAPDIVLAQYFRRQEAWGGGFSYSFENWVLKGEAVYFQTDNANGENPLAQPSHTDVVMGFERSIAKDYRILVQEIYRNHVRLKSSQDAPGANAVEQYVNQRLADINKMAHQYIDKEWHANLVRLSWSKEELGLEAEASFIYNWIGQDNIFRPKLSYLIRDDWRVTAGCDLYGGLETRTFGALGPYSSYFIETRYLF